ncbi:unnamed protein product [Vitrella brassicaformis CCMP3155]|uniref:Rhodanese domain-containing protein n=1 Tax=Vitrella brassicaformis (strain CCMP3155) TaxID=1169540 RepID=A0A0G4FCU5_VITBC|nr:unnamed protein product [Vitrella brassicaformis CCMP3155]|mmetsp:Transcript_30117/g.74801  ORF Transcript_30117/g.74801 Transcript_30117/m.74801 type:complete len:227 (-) Transcript_30117:1444-2124(-)|eukprot:CEM10737.1 unnamed protein product [Vitrella brassicaformis CCMP3155]
MMTSVLAAILLISPLACRAAVLDDAAFVSPVSKPLQRLHKRHAPPSSRQGMTMYHPWSSTETIMFPKPGLESAIPTFEPYTPEWDAYQLTTGKASYMDYLPLMAVATAMALYLWTPPVATADDILKDYEKGAVLLDVRTPSEYQRGSAPGALNMPMPVLVSTLNAHQPVAAASGGPLIDKDTEIVVFCWEGVRSSMATKALQQAGYNNVKLGGAWWRVKDIIEGRQ